MDAPNAAANGLSYGYDAAGRLASVAGVAGSFGYQYHSSGDPLYPASPHFKTLTLPSGMTINQGYDTAARLLSTALKNSSAAVLNSHAYTYDHELRSRQTLTAGNYIDYLYDPNAELTSATGKEAGGAVTRLHEKFGYTYDTGGNLATRTRNALVQTFALNNGLNQLSYVTENTGNVLTAAGTTTSTANSVTVNGQAAVLYADKTFAKDNLAITTTSITASATDAQGRTDVQTISVSFPVQVVLAYDNNGNTTGDGQRNFIYDDENQLTEVNVAGQWRTTFQYDGLLRLRVRKEYVWKNSAWTLAKEVRYVYDGMLLLQERDGNNVPQVSYTRGLDLSTSRQGAGGIGGLLARTDHTLLYAAPASAHAYYHADGSGNVTMLVNQQQGLGAKYLYDPFGNLIAKSGPLADANTLRFSSKEYHENSGLYYYGYRFYEPNLQRWVNRDPLASLPNLSLGLRRNDLRFQNPISKRVTVKPMEKWNGANPYEFVSNNTLIKIDPDGLWQVTIFGGGGYGGYVTFGYNSGQFNIGLRVGGGIGSSVSFDPFDSGKQPKGWKGNLCVAASIGEGIAGWGGEAGVGGSGPYASAQGRLGISSVNFNGGFNIPDGAAAYGGVTTGFSSWGAGAFVGAGISYSDDWEP